MWHYAKDGQRKGPVSEDALRNMARDGALSPTDLVWREGMSEWAPAAQATGFEFGGGSPPAAGPGALYGEPEAPPPTPSYSRQPPSYAQGSSPYAAPQAQLAPAEGPVTDYLPWAIVVTLFCCAFTGIPSIVFAVKANSAKAYGDMVEARRAEKLAKTWLWVSLGLGLAILALYVFAIMAGIMSEV